MTALDGEGALHAWARILFAMPRLAGAACVGRSSLFDDAAPDEDPDDVTYRHQAAATICRTCPALPACAAWIESHPARDKPSGVVAGRIPPERRLGRPKGAA